MIEITRLNNTKIVINAELIELIEETPDTVITLTNGHKFLAKESCEQIIELVCEYKRRIYSNVFDFLNNN